MILDEIASYAKERVAHDKQAISLEEMRSMAQRLPKGDFRLETALKRKGLSVICEVKKASPSKGVISEEFPFLEIARTYERAGADCISVLTEPKWFLGSDEIFQEIRQTVGLPMLRKDFTVDAYQIYQAKVIGADAVLLICALLDVPTLREYLTLCNSLGLSALVETHNVEEIQMAVEVGARIIGVNNRNLKDFTVDLTNAVQLRQYIPEDVVFVAESGVTTPADAAGLGNVGANAVLIGEALMRSADPALFLQQIREGVAV